MLTNGALVKYITFRMFPVGYPHWADTVRLRGKVLEVDHHCVASLGHDHRALNACNHNVAENELKQIRTAGFGLSGLINYSSSFLLQGPKINI